MKKIFHKNQLIITTLAFLIAIAGYVSYDRVNTKDQDDVQEANAGALEEDYVVDNSTYDIYEEIDDTQTEETILLEDDVETEEVAVNSTESEEEILNPGESILTGLTVGNVNYAAEVKLNREQVRSKNQAALLEIINNENITDEQKQDAIDQMVEMTDIAEKEADAEMMLAAKGFSNVVVSISGDSCDVVLDMGDVTDAKRAQVEDIVKRKTGIAAENIIITPISAAETAEN